MNLALHAVGELQSAVAQSEQGVVLAAANVLTGVDVGATLANQDFARANDLAGKTLAAQTLGVGIAAVSGGAKTFFMCHLISPPSD